KVRPRQLRLNFAWLSSIACCRRCSRCDLIASSTCPVISAPGVPGRGEYLKEKAPEKPTSTTRSSVAAKSSSVSAGEAPQKIVLGLGGEAHNEIGRQCKLRACVTEALDDAQIIGPRMLTVHGSENPVRTGLHRQMQLRHQLWQIAMRGY